MKRLALALLLFALALPAHALPWDVYYVQVAAKDREARSLVADLGMDIHGVLPGAVVGLASQRTIEALTVHGLAVTYLSLPAHAPGAAAGFPPGDAIYHDYAEMVSLLQSWAAEHPDIVQLYSIGDSVEGRALWTLKISDNVGTDESATEAGFVIVGQHHAREHISREVPLGFVQYLLDTYDLLYSTTQLVNSREIWVTPSLNPDGAEFDISTGDYQWWRKNRNTSYDSDPYCWGVDLNRNYGYHWGEGGSSPYTCDEVYRGPSAFSEPETAAFRDHVQAHGNVDILVSYHNYSELVLYPWGYTYSSIPQPDLGRHQDLAEVYADLTGYTDQQSSDLYITSGDTLDWAYGTLGITCFTVELSPGDFGDFYLPGNQVPGVIDDNVPAMLYLLAQTGEKAQSSEEVVTLDDILADVREYRILRAEGAFARRAAEPFLVETGCGMTAGGDLSWFAVAMLLLGLGILTRRARRAR